MSSCEGGLLGEASSAEPMKGHRCRHCSRGPAGSRPRTSWLALPRAVQRPITVNGGMPCTGWYDIAALDRLANESQDAEAMHESKRCACRAPHPFGPLPASGWPRSQVRHEQMVARSAKLGTCRRCACWPQVPAGRRTPSGHPYCLLSLHTPVSSSPLCSGLARPPLHAPCACRYVEGLIQEQVDAGIPSSRIVVGGFSQGGAMSLMMLRSKAGVRGWGVCGCVGVWVGVGGGVCV